MSRTKKITKAVTNMSVLSDSDEVIFFCHGSFEDRCKGALKLNWSGVNITNAYVFRSIELKSIESYKECSRYMHGQFQKMFNIDIEKIDVERDNLLDMLKTIDLKVDLSNKNKKIIVDISTFPRDRMLVLLDYLFKKTDISNIFLLYCEPKKYGSEKKAGWLSEGVRRIVPIPGFNGSQLPGKKKLLVLVLGHERERAHITIRNIEPDRLVIIKQGKQQYRKSRKCMTDKIRDSIMNSHSDKVIEEFEVGSRDNVMMREVIREIQDKYASDYNIYISIYGTKIQTLGVMQACQDRRKAQLLYTQPQKYNFKKYSNGVGKTWLLELDN